MNSPFLNVKTVHDLAAYFGHSQRGLDYILYVLPTKKKYKKFEIRKRNGEPREINAPQGPIRKLQIKLKSTLEEIYRPKEAVHGYIRGRSIKTNALKHRRKRWIAKVDIQDFFPSIHFGRIKGLFEAQPFSFNSEVAKRLAVICTYEGKLPQGAPTSPVISNIICSRMDTAITGLCKLNKVTYSRYADDLVFSTIEDIFPEQIVKCTEGVNEVGEALKKILTENTFSENTKKTTLISSKSRQMVTGLVVNRKLNVPKEYVRKLKGILHAWQKYGFESVSERFFESHYKRNLNPLTGSYPSLESIIRGRILHVGAVKGWKNPVFLNLAKKFEKISPNFKLDKVRSYHKNQLQIRLMVEGMSDLTHLEGAYNAEFKKRNQNLIINFDTCLALGGEKKLQEKLDQQKGIDQKILTICIFDRDIDKGLFKEITDNDNKYKKWSTGLYSTVLPLPSVYSCQPNEVTIESFYNNGDLKRYTEEGRRIYTKDEFNTQGAMLNSIFIKYINPLKKSYIVDSGVIAQIANDQQIISDVNVALSKTDFGLTMKRVGDGYKIHGFENIDFSLFETIFSLFDEIQADHLEHPKNQYSSKTTEVPVADNAQLQFAGLSD